jgi:dienelactone hydrolase
MILISIPKKGGSLFITLFLSFSASFAQTCDSITLDSISNPGEYTIGSLTEADGIRNGPDYNGATIYYPTNSTPPYSGMAIVPGYWSAQSTIQNWGPFLASHGIVTMTIGTNSIFEYPEARRDALLDALVTLKEENTRAGSPLLGQLDTTSLAVGGWSMGGGGAQLAAVVDPSIKAVMALCPWLDNGTLTPADINHSAPILFFSAENDAVAEPVLHADVHYDYTPISTSKMLFEIAGGGHQAANDPIGGGEYVGKIAVAWLKNFLVGDPCYCPLVLDTPPTASKYLLNVTCATCNNPDVPTVTFSPATVCDGSNATLTISGNLNDATRWSVYTGSCGGTLVDTTSGSTIIVTPSAPNTTYFIRGEGGCVTPGSCGQVTITVTPLDASSFNYSNSSYCVNDTDPSPNITGAAGGTFSSTAGLSLTTNSGAFDLSASTPGTYNISYNTSGSCPNSSNVNVTINALDDASFNYASSTFCLTGTDPTPTITGLGSGVFSGSAGLVIDASGIINLNVSGIGSYTVTYTTAGTCPASSNLGVSITTAPNATFSYTESPYCSLGVATATFSPGASAGVFSATPAGLVITPISGDIDLMTSSAGAYTVTNTIPASGSCAATSVISTIVVLPALTGVVSNTICNGDSIVVNGTTYNAVNSSGTEMFTNIGPNNCDSTVTVNITVQNAIDVSVTQSDETLTSNQNGAVYKWLDCDSGNAMIPTETNQAYTATSNGNYAVEVTVGSCIDTSSCISIITVEIIENTFCNSLTIYPNPTAGNFSIDLGESYKSTTINLTNLNGKLIQSKNYNESQLLNLKLKQPAGIYLLIIESGNEKAVIRLVKE